MVSNRESARRSRKRKQAHLADLEQQVHFLFVEERPKALHCFNMILMGSVSYIFKISICNLIFVMILPNCWRYWNIQLYAKWNYKIFSHWVALNILKSRYKLRILPYIGKDLIKGWCLYFNFDWVFYAFFFFFSPIEFVPLFLFDLMKFYSRLFAYYFKKKKGKSPNVILNTKENTWSRNCFAIELQVE
jgi:bZIP transcription factor